MGIALRIFPPLLDFRAQRYKKIMIYKHPETYSTLKRPQRARRLVI